ncbi:MAG: hypothetical protein HYT46_01580 [Candidatus Vogelbacteria bacterium]|nr:hypothetical protein [Candidatus Vogelbacteria bacterium]
MIKYLYGISAGGALFGLYWLIVSLISGWEFAVIQFSAYWYFIVALAAGFGLQIGLYRHLQALIAGRKATGRVVAVSGATSTVAMLSCCAHYLTNVLPVIATAGVISLIGQYQIELFWLGLALNLAGLGYIIRQIIKFRRS